MRWTATSRQLDTGNALIPLDFSSRSSLDDRKNAAEAQLVVESRRGSRVRPWHLVNVLKADDADNGDWLVSGVGFERGIGQRVHRPAEAVEVPARRRRRRAPRTAGTGGDLRIARRQWILRRRQGVAALPGHPGEYVAWARSPGRAELQATTYAWRGCRSLCRAHRGRGGDYTRYVWEKAPASAVKSPGDTNRRSARSSCGAPPTGGGAGPHRDQRRRQQVHQRHRRPCRRDEHRRLRFVLRRHDPIVLRHEVSMYRGKVTAVDASGVYVQTAEYGMLGPCQYVGAVPDPDDPVLVAM